MVNIKDNTVAAVNQMVNSSLVYHLGNPTAKTKILVVGNSITRHGPNKEIGWERDWGMAASAPEKDFVHRLFSMLTEDGKDIFMRVSQCADWEMNLQEEKILEDYHKDREFNADIMVFRLGENVPECNQPYFQEKMRDFVAYMCPNGKIVYTTCFWWNPAIDEAIRAIAKERNELCIDGSFSAEEKNMAIGQFAHGGVAMHPSDAGMAAIAKAIFVALKEVL